MFNNATLILSEINVFISKPTKTLLLKVLIHFEE